MAVMQQGQITGEQHRLAMGLCDPAGDRQGAIDTGCPSKPINRSPGGCGVSEALPIAHGAAVGKHQRQAGRQQEPQLARQTKLVNTSFCPITAGQLLI